MSRRQGEPFDAIGALLPLTEEQTALMLRGLAKAERRELDERWRAWAHRQQVQPLGDDWRTWLIRAGRGFGKTRAGAEWVSEVARRDGEARIAMVGASRSEAERVMVHGKSGVLAVAHADERPQWLAKNGEVRFPSGAMATVYSAGAPEALRGPEHHVAWCDELAKWPRGEMAWDNLLMGLRLGERPRVVVTTTPRPTALMRRIQRDPATADVVGRTWDNPHLPPDYHARMAALYEGTRLGRQELDGELLEDHEGALWTRALIEACRWRGEAPGWTRVVVAVDPPASADGDACGIVCVALGADGIGYVLADASDAGASPAGWAAAVADCARAWGADRVVAEANQGGDMVRHVLDGADAGLPVVLVHASRGKLARAEPVANLYEQGRVRHLGVFRALEDELAGLVVGGVYRGPGRSPDRADALVWGLSELMLGRRGVAQVRGL